MLVNVQPTCKIHITSTHDRSPNARRCARQIVNYTFSLKASFVFFEPKTDVYGSKSCPNLATFS